MFSGFFFLWMYWKGKPKDCASKDLSHSPWSKHLWQTPFSGWVGLTFGGYSAVFPADHLLAGSPLPPLFRHVKVASSQGCGHLKDMSRRTEAKNVHRVVTCLYGARRPSGGATLKPSLVQWHGGRWAPGTGTASCLSWRHTSLLISCPGFQLWFGWSGFRPSMDSHDAFKIWPSPSNVLQVDSDQDRHISEITAKTSVRSWKATFRCWYSGFRLVSWIRTQWTSAMVQ